MEALSFEDYAVAFIDVLGFKSFVRDLEKGDAAKVEAFRKLLHVIKEAPLPVRRGDAIGDKIPDHVGLSCIGVSDSFVISAPVSIDKSYNGLVAVCMRAIQLSHQLLQLGFLVRGGVAVGKLFRDGINVFGTAYQNAYEVESKCAVTPRILLHETARQHAEKNSHLGYKIDDLSIFLVRDKNDMILDVLESHWTYIGQGPDVDIGKVYNGYKVAIESNLNNEGSAAIKEKWSWFACLFNAKIECGRGMEGVSPISRPVVSDGGQDGLLRCARNDGG